MTSSPATYTFRRATSKEWRSHYRSPILDWILLSLALGAIALGAYWAIAHGFSVWEQYRQDYEIEYNQLPVWPTSEEWSLIVGSVWRTTLPFLIVAGACLISRWIAKRILIRQNKHSSFWVACYQGNIIGRAVTLSTERYTLLTILYVTPEHRGQRVGSHLLWHSLQEVNRPVYLICHHQLQPFYRRLGFASVSGLNVPDDLKRPLAPDARMMKLSLPPLVPAPIIYLPFTPSRKWSIHLLSTWQEKLDVYQSLGKRKRFRQARRQRWVQLIIMIVTPFLGVNIVIEMLKHIPGLGGLKNFDIPIIPVVGLYISSFSLAVLLITLLMGLLWLVLSWQEWSVQDGNRTIAYVQLCSYGHCTVLHQLHIEPQYPRLQMTQFLLGYFSRKVQFPIYVTCTRRDRKFYDKLGFTRVRRSALPFEMKVVRWGNPIPLQLSYELAAHGYKHSLSEP